MTLPYICLILFSLYSLWVKNDFSNKNGGLVGESCFCPLTWGGGQWYNRYMKMTTDEAIAHALKTMTDKMRGKTEARDKVLTKVEPLKRQIEVCQLSLNEKLKEVEKKNEDLDRMGVLYARAEEAGREFEEARAKQNENIAYATNGHPEFLQTPEVVALAGRITELEIEILGLQSEISKIYYRRG